MGLGRLPVSGPRESPRTAAEIAEACREAFRMPRTLAAAMGTLGAAAMSSVPPPDAMECRAAALTALADDLQRQADGLRQGTPESADLAASLRLTAYEVPVAARVLAAASLMVRNRITEPLP